MNRPLRHPCLALLALLAAPAAGADMAPEFYGELNISRDFVEDGIDGWVSNVSRAGFKGEAALSDDMSVIYQVEQEIDVLRGGWDKETLFSMRNTFIGVQGGFGKVFFGAHDTPFKRAQGNVDLFNDQFGDIKALVSGEVRARDSYAWHSPLFADHVTVEAMHVPADDNFRASNSVSFGWTQEDLAVTVAMDSEMRKNEREVAKTKVYDAYRGAIAYTPGDWKLGLLLQRSEQTNAVADSETAYLVSVARQLGQLTLKGQWGRSDILRPNQRQALLGADYKISENTMLYGIVSSDDDVAGNRYTLSFGTEIKF